MLKIRKGDKVIVLSGQYKGLKLKVISINTKHNKAIVVNMDGIVHKTSIYLCKIAFIDPINGKPTRIGFKFDNGIKHRIAKRSGTMLSNSSK